MTISVHRLIDTLKNRDKVMQGGVIMSREHVRSWIEDLKFSDKFDFGQVPNTEDITPVDKADYEFYVAFDMPALSNDEVEAWAAGMVPLPSKVCTYEFEIVRGNKSLMLIVDQGDCWSIRRADFFPPSNNSPESQWVIHSVGAVVSKQIDMTKEGTDRLKVWAHTPTPEMLKSLTQEEKDSTRSIVRMAINLTLMLYSRSTKIERTPRAKQTYTELRKGVTRAFEYRTVTLIPKAIRERGEAQGGTHESPRFHWRRSHLRRFDHQTPGSKWCPHLLGPDGSMGCFATLIPKFAVGLKERGEVVHEYKVKDPA